MIFHLTSRDSLNTLRPFLRYGDYVVSSVVGCGQAFVWYNTIPLKERLVEIVTHRGFEKVDINPSNDFLSRDIMGILSDGRDLRFLYLCHPSNAFYINSDGSLLRIDNGKPVCNLKKDGLPTQDKLESIVADNLFRIESCAFCEHYPLCGGYFSGNCDTHKPQLEELRRALLRFRYNRSATVFVSFSCINNCIFCAPAEKRKEKPLSKDETLNFIERCAETGCSNISFSGAGEPTLNPDLVEYVKFAKSLGILSIVVFTNGFNLSQNLLDDLIESGVNGFLVSLHGNKESHDVNVRRIGSYNEAISAMRKITEKKIPLTVNTCITNHNISHIEEVLNIAKEINPKVRHTLSFPEISGNAVSNITDIPSLKEAATAVMDLNSRGHKFMVEGIPLCLIKGFPRNMIIRSSPNMYKDNRGEGYSSNGIYLDLCRLCQERRGCEGINRGYHKIKGADFVKEEIEGYNAIRK